MPLFNRVCEIVVGKPDGKAISIEYLRMEFRIEKSSGTTPNKGIVKIYNMNTESRALVETVNNIVIIKAGYEQDSGAITLFTGTTTRSLSIKDGPDIVTELELNDGVIPFRDAKVSLSYPPNTPALTVLSGVADAFGLVIKSSISGITNKNYSSGFAFAGKVRDAMNKVCQFLDIEWSIQNNEIQIIKKGGVFADTAVVLSSDTGMIGYPMREAKSMTEKAAAKKGVKYPQAGVVRRKIMLEGDEKQKLEVQGYKVKSLLNPLIYPGSYVQLNSFGIDGEFFRVESCDYVGDTHGADWYVEATLRFI